MKVVYIFRNRVLGFSIHNVFNTLMEEVKKDKYDIEGSSLSCPSPRSMPWDIIRNSWFIFVNRDKKSINHITGHIHDVVLGLIGCKVVLTIHDLVFLDNVKNPIKRFYKWLFWLYLPIKIADKITCISETTKKSLNKFVNSDKIVVIHNPLNPAFKSCPKKFNHYKPTILHIGTGWNKNLHRTISALKGISCHLRIIGKLDEEVLKALSINNIDFSNAYNLDDAEIVNEYIGCDIVNFPSIYEGFGMPIIEGQSTGRVVVASKIDPLMEVAGGAAHFINPYDIESMRSGYIKVINDSEYRELLLAKGLRNIQQFRVENIALKYEEIYKELNDDSRP